jgi:hypothetical protein
MHKKKTSKSRYDSKSSDASNIMDAGNSRNANNSDALTTSIAGTPETWNTHAAEGKFTDWDSSNGKGISQSRDSRDVIRSKNIGNSKVDTSTRGNGFTSDPTTAGPQHCWRNHSWNAKVAAGRLSIAGSAGDRKDAIRGSRDTNKSRDASSIWESKKSREVRIRRDPSNCKNASKGTDHNNS